MKVQLKPIADQVVAITGASSGTGLATPHHVPPVYAPESGTQPTHRYCFRMT